MKIVLGALLFAAATGAIAQTPVPEARSTTSAPMKSATKARDIGGFALGMSIREANELAPVTPIGGDGFETRRDGITYVFGVTPRGRIYRVQSSQPLGQFTIDRAFTQTLRAKLIAKYGRPLGSGDETFYWELIEPTRRDDGTVLPFKTMWASAYVSGGEDVSIEMTMLDFRILWQDQAELNRPSRDRAAAKIEF